jgi:uncharacterized protein YhbP (UPF0306 family)
MSELRPQELIEGYLSENKIMQLATSRDGRPWICNLHFVADEKSNVYWLSKPSRRHSEDIDANPPTAITIAVRTEKPLIGVQAEGEAHVVTDEGMVRSVMELYVERQGTDKGFADTIIDGSNEHKVYKFTPKRFSLFDQKNFANQPPVEWVVNSTR